MRHDLIGRPHRLPAKRAARPSRCAGNQNTIGNGVRELSNRASAVPYSWPGYQTSSTERTLSSHGMVTALLVLSTTTVFGFALATASMSASCSTGSRSELRSLLSAVKSLANTTATSASLAVWAAWAIGSPSSGVWAPSRMCEKCTSKEPKFR